MPDSHCRWWGRRPVPGAGWCEEGFCEEAGEADAWKVAGAFQQEVAGTPLGVELVVEVEESIELEGAIKPEKDTLEGSSAGVAFVVGSEDVGEGAEVE